MIATTDDTTCAVFKFLETGIAPSEIDARLGLDTGEARRLIVRHWAADRRAAKHEPHNNRYRK